MIRRLLGAAVVALAGLSASLQSHAAPGELDPAFGSGGIARVPASLANSTTVVATARQHDGKVLIAAQAWASESAPKRAMVGRLNADASADTSFGIDGWARIETSDWDFSGGDITVLAMAPGAGGKILAVIYDRFQRIGIVRLGADGKRDPGFAFGRVAELNNGSGTTARIAEQPDGGIVVAVSGAAFLPSQVHRLDSSGRQDWNWGQFSVVSVHFPSGSGMINALHVRADGSICVGGWTSTTFAEDLRAHDFAIFKITAAGALDAQFGSSGFVTLDLVGGRDEVAVLVEDAQSRLVALGKGSDAFSFEPNGLIGAARLDAHTGALDTTFGAQGKARINVLGVPLGSYYGADVTDVQVASDGAGLLISGRATRNDPSTPATLSFLARLDSAGQPDAGFGINGSVLSVRDFQYTPGGDSFAGIAVEYGIVTAVGTRRVAVDASHGATRAFALRQRFRESDGAAVGEAGVGQAINALGALAVKAAALADGRTLLVGSVGDMARVTRLRADGSLDVDFRDGGHFDFQVLGFATSGRAIAVDASGKILVASIVRVSGFQDIWEWAVTRLTADGFPDASFDTGFTFAAGPFFEGTNIAGIVAQPDGRILVAGAGDRAVWVARLNGDGSRDTSFNGGSTSAGAPSSIEANALALQPDGSVLVATTVLPDRDWPYPDLFLPRFTPSGARDWQWMGEFTRSRRQSVIAAQSMAVQSDGKVLIGGDCFMPFDYQQRTCIVLLQPNGFSDNDWEFPEEIPGLGVAHVTGVGFTRDGSIVAGGDFGVGYPFAVRLTPRGSLDPTYNGTGIAQTTQVQSGDWIANVVDAEGRVRSLGFTPAWATREELLLVQFQGGVLPDTFITNGAPPVTASLAAGFDFTSDDPTATFECSLDGAAFVPCRSHDVYWNLAEGDHEFRVRAVNSAGADPTPAEARWRIDVTAPETTITSAPDANDNSHAFVATFAFSSNEAGATFECSLDGASFAACASPRTYNGLAKDKHTFQVRAKDAAGNVDATPASYAWKSH